MRLYMEFDLILLQAARASAQDSLVMINRLL